MWWKARQPQVTDADVAPTGMDSDGDGTDDAFDPDSGGQFTVPVDTDGDGTTDQLDTDSDGDDIHDTIESGLVLSGNDADGDGIDDAVNASYANTDGDVDDPINNLENATDNDPSDVDYRSVNDKDGDGVADFEDLDDDNDGILDIDEGLLPVQLVGDPTVGTNGFIQIAGTGNRATVAEGDIYIIPNAIPLGDGTFVDLRLEVEELNFSDAGETVSIDVPAVDNIPRVSFRGFDAVDNDNVIFNITFVEPGSANAGSPAGTPVELSNVDVDQGDIEAASNNDNLTEFGSVGNAVDGSGNSVPSIVSILNPDTSTVIVEPTLFAGATIPGFTDYIVTDPGDDGSLSNEGITSAGDDPADTTGRFSFNAVSSFDWVYGLTGSEGTSNRTTRLDIFAEVSRDTDGDGLADHCDLDSDNDGISDLVESGQDPSVVDLDGDGVHDGPVDPDTGIPLAANGGAGVDPVDSDMDGIDDYLDLDSDNDGIPDAVENQPTAGYQSPAIGTDTDGDGIVDTFDTVDGHGGTFAAPQDTDGDGTPDYLDEDSDNDGQNDIDESGLMLSGDDLDGDGIDDGVGASFSDTDGIIANPSNDLDNEGGDTTEVGYREVVPTIAVAKQVSGTTALANGNFSVTYELVVENTGSVDLADVSLIDDLATQFGDAFINAGSLTLVTPPASGGIALDSSWDGDLTAEMIDQTAMNLFVAGESFVVSITVEVDPDATGTSGELDNQAIVAGAAVDAMGNPFTDDMGNPILATDLSDSGAVADSDNPTAPGDDGMGGTNDPTPLAIPDLRVAKQANTVEEVAGLNGVFDVTYLVVIENTGTIELTDLQITDDVTALTNFGDAYDPTFIGTGTMDRTGLVALPTVVGTPVAGMPNFNAGFLGGPGAASGIFDGTSGALQVGEQIMVTYTVRIDADELLNPIVPDTSAGNVDVSEFLTLSGDASFDGVNEGLVNLTSASASQFGSAQSQIQIDLASDFSISSSILLGSNDGGADGIVFVLHNDPAGDTANGSAIQNGFAVEFDTFDNSIDGSDENGLVGGADHISIFDTDAGSAEFYLSPVAVPVSNLEDGNFHDVLLEWNAATNTLDVTLDGNLVTSYSGDIVNEQLAGDSIAHFGFSGRTGTFSNQHAVEIIEVDGVLVNETAPNPGNQVQGTANSSAGMVDDLSDDGLNPNNDNGEGTTDDPTPFQVPQIRLFKAQGDAVSNGDGTSTITVTLRVQNSGTVPLSDLSLTEDLADQFGGALISTTSPTIDATLAPTSTIPSTLINSAWVGDTSLDLFDPAEMSELLNSGEEFSITFDVTVDPDLLDDNSDFLTNTADVTGVGQNFDGSDITVSDQSGADNGDGLDTDEPTAAVVPEIAVAKAAGDAVANGDDFDVTFTLVVENTGSVNLNSLTLFDDLAAEFGNALVGVSGLSVQNFAGSGTAPTANAAWEGDTSLSLFNDDGL